MAYKKAPTKSKIRKNSSTVRRDRRGASSNAPAISKEQIYTIQDIQLDIDQYNNIDIYKIDPYFKDLDLKGNRIIIRPFQENLIKYIDDSNEDDILIDAWYRQIDARDRTTDQPKWMPTPFPYIEMGVIMAISPEVQLIYAKQIKEMSELGLDTSDMKIPQVGDVIEYTAYYSSSWYKENRYYIDKQGQCQDFVLNQHEIRLNHFEHYFKMEHFDLAAVYSSEQTGNKRGFIDLGEENYPQWVVEEQQDIDNKRQELLKKIEKLNKEAEEAENDNSDNGAVVKDITSNHKS